MIVRVRNKNYEFSYFPFFRMKEKRDYHIYGMRLPSGAIEEVHILDLNDPISCLYDYAEFLILEYVLEDDIMLTPKALKLKNELLEMLNYETG